MTDPLREHFTTLFGDFDANAELSLSGEDKSALTYPMKHDIIVVWLCSCIRKVLHLDPPVANRIAEQACDVIDIDTGTFDIDELVDRVIQIVHLLEGRECP